MVRLAPMRSFEICACPFSSTRANQNSPSTFPSPSVLPGGFSCGIIISMEDTRNLIDAYKGLSNEQIFDALNKTRLPLEIAIENVEHDFNIGSIVRTANSFNVSRVHIIGKKKYNRRGAMCTDKYLEIIHHASVEDFLMAQKGRELVAIENNTDRAEPLNDKKFIQDTTLIFGSEGSGITSELLEKAHDVRFIESFGSTRSVNVGVAAGIAMYEYVRQIIFAH